MCKGLLYGNIPFHGVSNQLDELIHCKGYTLKKKKEEEEEEIHIKH
jgi:hypothetical protein